MDSIVGEAWSAAQKMNGRELWERLSDFMRVRAGAYEKTFRMNAEQMRDRPLVSDHPSVHPAETTK